jgi:hypothetical protein
VIEIPLTGIAVLVDLPQRGRAFPAYTVTLAEVLVTSKYRNSVPALTIADVIHDRVAAA